MNLINGDCLEHLANLPDQSIDMVMCDPPYGVTDCAWDKIIPFAPMWDELKRITKPRSPIVIFACQPFTTQLIISNQKMFRYCWIWKKNRATGFLGARLRPMNNYEEIVVFSQKTANYYPQGVIPSVRKERKAIFTEIYSNQKSEYYTTGTNYPKRVIEFQCVNHAVHPTQKPVPLLEFLIRTYTQENEMVLDFAMGSGTTGVACKNLNRSFIGIESDRKYYDLARNRINTV